MTGILNLKSLTVVSLTVALGGCSADATRPAEITVAQQSSKSVAVAQWLQAPQKHNNSGLSMRYKLEGSLKVGEPVTLRLELSGATSSDAQVSIAVPKTLSMAGQEGLQKSDQGFQSTLKINETNTRSLTFTPTSEGEHFVSFQLTQNAQQSSAGVMIRVGEKAAALPTLGERVTTGQGEKLIVMPAK